MVFLALAAGTAYTYFVNRNADNLPAQKDPVSSSPSVLKTTAPGPNAPNSASVQFIDSPVKQGQNTSITVTTGPDAKCTIIAAYNNVVSKDSGLKPKAADLHGSVSWTWTVDANAAIGKWPIKVTCDRNTRIAYVEGYLEVAK